MQKEPRGELMRKGTVWKDIANRKRMIEVCPKVDFYIFSTVGLSQSVYTSLISIRVG